jgi:hypothetical protein
MINIVNIKSGQKYDFYAGRANKTYNVQESILANPFIIGKDGDRNEVIEKYKIYFYDRINKDKEFKEYVLSLKGLTGACWCVPNRCHLEIIREYLQNN